jgi:hypothetical protein
LYPGRDRIREAPVKSAADFGLAVVAGLVAFGLLLPMHGADTIPRQCFSIIGYGVPCADWFAMAAGAAATLVVAALFWLRSRRAAPPASD